MADRKKKRAYLDDFEKDLNGNYQYRGAHYHYKGTKSRGRALAGLWVLCGGGAALVVAAGLVPGATAYAPFWLLLPYMAGLLAAVYAVYLLVRLTAAGEPLRAYLHEQTVQKLPGSCTAGGCVCSDYSCGPAGAVGAGAGKTCPPGCCLPCCRLQRPRAFVLANKQFKALKYEKQE